MWARIATHRSMIGRLRNAALCGDANVGAARGRAITHRSMIGRLRLETHSCVGIEFIKVYFCTTRRGLRAVLASYKLSIRVYICLAIWEINGAFAFFSLALARNTVAAGRGP